MAFVEPYTARPVRPLSDFETVLANPGGPDFDAYFARRFEGDV